MSKNLNPMSKNSNKTQNRVWVSMVAVVLLFVMWMITSYAFISSFITKEDNIFETALVKINLNNGVPVFDDEDFKMEPGRSVKKDFIVQNRSTVDIYYRLYLEDVEGALQEVLTFDLYDGDQLIHSSAMKDFDFENAYIGETILKPNEIKTLTAVVTMDKAAGNAYRETKVVFDMTADGTQSKNNPDKIFDNE